MSVAVWKPKDMVINEISDLIQKLDGLPKARKYYADLYRLIVSNTHHISGGKLGDEYSIQIKKKYLILNREVYIVPLDKKYENFDGVYIRAHLLKEIKSGGKPIEGGLCRFYYDTKEFEFTDKTCLE